MQKAQSERDAHLELLRIVSSFLVIVCHTICYIDPRTASPALRLAAFFGRSASKVAVPIFLMITGATLLTKQDTLQRTFERVTRIAIVLVLFSFPYVLQNPFAFKIHSVKTYFIQLYEWHVTTSFWYLYAYAGILLMVPLLQRLVSAMKDMDFLYFFAISMFMFGFWPLVVEYTSVPEYTEHFHLPLFVPHICYLLLGYKLYQCAPPKRPLAWFALFIASVGAHTALYLWDFFTRPGTQFLFMDSYDHLPMILASAACFQLLRCLPLGKLTGPVCRLGRCAFGIFLVSDFFLKVCEPVYYPVRDALGTLPAMFALQTAAFLASLACAAVFVRIPGIKKLV